MRGDEISAKFFRATASKVRRLEMNSLTVELLSKASYDCHPNKTLSTFTYFILELTKLEREWEVAVTGLLQGLYQRALIMSPRFPSQGLLQTLCPSGSDIKKSEKNRKDQKREKYEKTPIKLRIDKITQRIFLSLSNEKSFLVIYKTNLCHVFGCEDGCLWDKCFHEICSLA